MINIINNQFMLFHYIVILLAPESSVAPRLRAFKLLEKNFAIVLKKILRDIGPVIKFLTYPDGAGDADHDFHKFKPDQQPSGVNFTFIRVIIDFFEIDI
jgi:hypothetical protein